MMTALEETASELLYGNFLLDSEAIEHKVGHINWLHSIQSMKPHPIRLGDGNLVSATHQRELSLKANLKYGKETYIRDVTLYRVLYVPKLKSNLISCAALCKTGFNSNSGLDRCNAMKDGTMIIQGSLQNGAYVLDVQIRMRSSGAVIQCVSDDESDISGRNGHGVAYPSISVDSGQWHARLGYDSN